MSWGPLKYWCKKNGKRTWWRGSGQGWRDEGVVRAEVEAALDEGQLTRELAIESLPYVGRGRFADLWLLAGRNDPSPDAEVVAHGFRLNALVDMANQVLIKALKTTGVVGATALLTTSEAAFFKKLASDGGYQIEVLKGIRHWRIEGWADVGEFREEIAKAWKKLDIRVDDIETFINDVIWARGMVQSGTFRLPEYGDVREAVVGSQPVKVGRVVVTNAWWRLFALLALALVGYYVWPGTRGWEMWWQQYWPFLLPAIMGPSWRHIFHQAQAAGRRLRNAIREHSRRFRRHHELRRHLRNEQQVLDSLVALGILASEVEVRLVEERVETLATSLRDWEEQDRQRRQSAREERRERWRGRREGFSHVLHREYRLPAGPGRVFESAMDQLMKISTRSSFIFGMPWVVLFILIRVLWKVVDLMAITGLVLRYLGIPGGILLAIALIGAAVKLSLKFKDRALGSRRVRFISLIIMVALGLAWVGPAPIRDWDAKLFGAFAGFPVLEKVLHGPPPATPTPIPWPTATPLPPGVTPTPPPPTPPRL